MQNLRNPAEDESGASHRIGAVARLAGVPVTTLRVWEMRYGAFSPAKTSGRHRLYTEADVIKARLLRQLAAAGHSIGAIAALPVAQLRQLAGADAGVPAAGSAPPARRVGIVLVGAAMAARVSSEWRQRHFGDALQVERVFADLDEAAAASEAPPAEGTALLLARLHTLQPASYERLLAAVQRLGVARVIVLYGFGPQVLVEALRAAGVQLRREPVPDAELAELVRAVVFAAPAGGAALIPPRRYSDATLAQVAGSPNGVVCECPRHLADIIGQLASFEAYSEECLHDTAEDARLHAYLRSVAGSARAMFEDALRLAAGHGGLVLEEDGPAGAVA